MKKISKFIKENWIKISLFVGVVFTVLFFKSKNKTVLDSDAAKEVTELRNKASEKAVSALEESEEHEANAMNIYENMEIHIKESQKETEHLDDEEFLDYINRKF